MVGRSWLGNKLSTGVQGRSLCSRFDFLNKCTILKIYQESPLYAILNYSKGGFTMTKILSHDCPCPYNCIRHGNCKTCKEYHKNSKTYCEKIKNTKK
jgi:hypothetical protein